MASLPVWDRQRLLIRLADDQTLVQALLSTFIHQWETLRKEMDESVASQDHQRLSRIAHTMKGAAANLEAIRIRETSLAIEKLAAAGQLDNVRQLIPELDRQYHLFLQESGMS